MHVSPMVRSFSARYNAAGDMMILTSPAFRQNHQIPRRHTGDGEDVSPALSWSEFIRAMHGHVLAEVELVGTYQR